MLQVAVVGPGRAGGARMRALEARSDAQLSAVVARDGAPTLAQVLADAAVDAVAVSTPNALHARQVRAALEAGKHVLVDYPLAATAEEGRALFDLAAQTGRVLHVEHIELLSPSHAAQCERVRDLGRPRGGALTVRGTSEGWIGDEALAGTPALRAVARLHRLLDLFGLASVTGAALEPAAGGYRLQVDLEFQQGGAARLVEERGDGLSRETRWSIDCDHGRLGDPPPAAASGLFERDLDAFLARVRCDAPHYVADERVVEVLELVGAIERAVAA
ncbi:MAG: Gfo/Idh/MocA family oxidoreductase [Deltaproteobacteria bacterium]|nr:Gfo/Idh/MocA family oxidoreductase [Deltaproteobacteria bacterium]MBW2416803.1 Gfo/Idh/MocA family oxidoreductase [Deltaproteobacteria bacterium]